MSAAEQPAGRCCEYQQIRLLLLALSQQLAERRVQVRHGVSHFKESSMNLLDHPDFEAHESVTGTNRKLSVKRSIAEVGL